MNNLFYSGEAAEDTSALTLGKLPYKQLKRLKKKDYYKSRHILNYRNIKEPQIDEIDLNSNNDKFEFNIIMKSIQEKGLLKQDPDNSIFQQKDNQFDAQLFHKEMNRQNETSIKNIANSFNEQKNTNLNFENQHSQCQVEKGKLREFYEELVNSLQKEVLQLKQYENQIEQYQQRNLKVLKENRELSMQIQMQQHMNNQDKNKELMLNDLNQKIENLKNQNFMLKEKLEYQQEICRNMNQKLQNKNELEQSKTQLNMSNIEMIQLKERLKNLEYEKKQYKEELEDRLNSLQHQLSKLEISKENSFSRDIKQNSFDQPRYNDKIRQNNYYERVQERPRQVLVSRDAIQNVCLNSIQPINYDCQHIKRCHCIFNSVQQQCMPNNFYQPCTNYQKRQKYSVQAVKNQPKKECQCQNMNQNLEKENIQNRNLNSMNNDYYEEKQIPKRLFSKSQYEQQNDKTPFKRKFQKPIQINRDIPKVYQTPQKVKLREFKEQILQENNKLQSKADQYLRDQHNIQITQSKNQIQIKRFRN